MQGKSSVPAVAKCIAIIRMLDGRQQAGASLADIAGGLGFTKSHCLSILRTLESHGWVNRDEANKRYLLGTGLIRDISGLVRRDNPSAEIHAILRDLSRDTYLPSILCQVDENGEFVVVDKVEAIGELLVSVKAGHRYPWDAPAQLRARLGASSPAVVEETIARGPRAFTSATIVDRARLEKEIARVAKRGVSVGRSEYTTGIMTIATAITDPAGVVTHVVQTPGVQTAMEPQEEAIVAALLNAARRIRDVLAHR